MARYLFIEPNKQEQPIERTCMRFDMEAQDLRMDSMDRVLCSCHSPRYRIEALFVSLS